MSDFEKGAEAMRALAVQTVEFCPSSVRKIRALRLPVTPPPLGEVERLSAQIAKAFEGHPNGYWCYCKRMKLAAPVHVHHNAVTQWTHGPWWCGADAPVPAAAGVPAPPAGEAPEASAMREDCAGAIERAGMALAQYRANPNADGEDRSRWLADIADALDEAGRALFAPTPRSTP